MALITDAQAQQMIDNYTVYRMKVDGAFDCYHFDAELEGYFYAVCEHDPNKLSPTADKATVEAYIKGELKKQEYQGARPVITDEEV